MMNKHLSKTKIFWKEKVLPLMKDSLCRSRHILPRSSNKEGSQLSIRVAGSSYLKKKYNYTGDVFMFVEDMYTGIMPFSHIRAEGRTFSATIEPFNQELEDLVAEALNRQGYKHSLADALCDFVRNAAHSLFFYGAVAYEIVYETDSRGNVTRFSFVDVHPLGIKKIFGSYFQIIPWGTAKRSHVKVSLIRIPKNKMLYLEFPKELGGKRGLRRILRRLANLSRQIIPNFQMEAMKENKDLGFDFGMYAKGKYLEKARLTRYLGWNQRKIPDNEILEYYSMCRYLKQKMSQAIVREKIIDVINQTLNGPILNLGIRIVTEGLLTVTQIKEEFEMLKGGNVEFMDIFEKTRN